MNRTEWEEKWERYILAYAHTVKTNAEKARVQERWLVHFVENSIILTNFLIPVILTFIKEFNMKSPDFSANRLDKKMVKSKRAEAERFVKLLLMDYFATVHDNPHNLQLLQSHGFTHDSFKLAVGQLMKLSKKEKDLFNLLSLKRETFTHTILMFEYLQLGKDSRNEALVEGVELIKEEAFNLLDKRFQQFIQQYS